VRLGERVLQIGAGSGYYTAILAELAGPSGRVDALDDHLPFVCLSGRDLSPTPAPEIAGLNPSRHAERPMQLCTVPSEIRRNRSASQHWRMRVSDE